MASPENSFDAGESSTSSSPSPSPAGREANNLAFKPPTRPGASLRGRKSTAALSDIGTNRLHTTTPSLAIEQDSNNNNSASTSRAPSPASSSYDSPAALYEGAPSSKEAQALAATQAARQRLQSLYTDNDRQTTAAGLLGQGLLEQRRQIEVLREELHDELSRLGHGGDDGSVQDADRYQLIQSLADRIDQETAEMASKRKILISELLSAGGDQHVTAPTAGSSPATATQAAYAFLASDPSARATTTPTKSNIPDVSVTSASGGPTPRQNNRRARNAAAPSSIGDQNLVNQLQEGLVQEIRRLQGLLLQRDQQIKLSEEGQKKVEEELGLWKPKAMALMEQEDAMKQENWDLQVSGQQLEEQLEQERAAVRKLEADKTRATRELAKARETADERKVQMDGQAAELERIQALRETETALARREKASMQRDYSDLQTEMNKYKAEALKLERANVSRSASHSLLLDSLSGADESVDGRLPAEIAAARRKFDSAVPPSPGDFSEDVSNGQSPLGSRLLRDREIADARGKLAIAHKKAGKDSADKRRLREQNAELRRLLAKAGVEAPGSDDVETSDDDEEEAWMDEEGSVAGRDRSSKLPHRLPKSSTRPNIASRLGLSTNSHDFDEGDEAEDSFEDATDDQNSEVGFDGDSTADDTGSEQQHGKKYRRRSTIRPKHNKRVSMSSPLVHNVTLSEEAGEHEHEHEAPEQDVSVDDDIATRRMPTSRRSAAPRMRPASDAVPTAALGNELEGLGNVSMAESTASRAADGSVVEHSVEQERELQDSSAQTDAPEDLVAPALAAQRAEHEAAVAKLHAAHQNEQREALEQLHTTTTAKHDAAIVELQQRHKARVDDLIREHDEGLAQVHIQHKAKVDELLRNHGDVLSKRDAKAAEESSNLEKSHASALSNKDAAHAAAVAAALASLGKKHDSAMSEARTRHTQALASQVAAHTSALSQAERTHKAALAERERLHKSDIERLQYKHQQELESRNRDHQGMVEDINATNDAFVSQRDAAYNAALKDRDEQVVKARAEVTKLRSELDSLRAELASARKELAQALADSEKRVKELEAAEAAHVAALAAANAQVDDIKREQADAAQMETVDDGERSASVEPDSGRPSMSVDAHDEFQDAVDEPVVAASSSPVQEEGIRRVVLADLKDSSMQTDDELWAQTQQERLMLRPTSVAYARPGETAVGPGGITVLGGYPGRPRDSVGTFGATNNDAAAAASPALTSFSAHQADLYRRPSMDSSVAGSSRRPSEVPVDKSKPPVMQVPPPPSMPPPSHIPRKSAASYVEDGTMAAPPRPTSPPPASLVRQARPSTLRVPSSRESEAGGGGVQHPRSVSRASSAAGGHPPSSYNAPAASLRNKLTRRGSNISGVDGGESAASGSILSRLSGRNTPRHSRQASGTSVASDATSEMSRRHSYASSQASEAIGDRTVTVDDAPRSRRGRPSAGGLPGTLGDGETTDPAVIQAITQTMIGEYLFKYTRRTMRGGHSDKRHRRYFWVHPYTKMLYWTMTDPGGARMGEGVSKSACIEDVSVIEDYNISPPGLFHASIVIKTAARDLKVTAPDRERHETWLNALGYLVNRANVAGAAKKDSNIVANATVTPAGTTRSRAATTSRAARLLSPARSFASVGRTKSHDAMGGDDDLTPRAARPRNNSSTGVGANAAAATPSLAGSTYRGKRRDTAAWEYLQNASTTRRAQSEMGFRNDDAAGANSYYDEMGRLDNRLKTAEQMLEENEEQGEGFEGLDNVRACCGGAHDVGALAHKQYMHKQRRGSTQSGTVGGAATTSRASLGRPSSRLSVGTTSTRAPRARGNSNASSILERPGSAQGLPPVPPQMGPLNLNGRGRGSVGTVGTKASKGNGNGAAPTGAQESFASMFDLPPATARTAR